VRPLARRAGRLPLVPRSRVATRVAAAARRRADRLGHLAEAVSDRELCRDVRALQHRLREQAGRADQRARLLEAAAGWRPRGEALMQSFWSQWPILPLPHRDAQGAAETAAAAPVLAPPAAPQSACVECGAALPAKTGPGRRPTRCNGCRRPKHNGHDPKPLPDLKARPLRIPNYEDPMVAQALEPPPLPWQTR
jgi:hypothetical protein